MTRGRKSLVIDGMKECSRCDEMKPVDAFAIDRANKTSGRRSSCKACDIERYDPLTRAYWREANREKLRANMARRYRNNKTRLIEQMKRRRLIPRGRAVSLFNCAKGRAKKYNMEFNITHEDVEIPLNRGVCEASGIVFDLTPPQRSFRNPFAPSLDRVDNKKGYLKGNIRVVCNMYNSGKGEADEIDFIAMCVGVAEQYGSYPSVIQRLKELRNAEF